MGIRIIIPNSSCRVVKIRLDHPNWSQTINLTTLWTFDICVVAFFPADEGFYRWYEYASFDAVLRLRLRHLVILSTVTMLKAALVILESNGCFQET